MPGAFVAKERVAVTIDGKNVIYIRPKMGTALYERLKGSMAKSVFQNGHGTEVELDIGRANTMLLTENILDWEGPDFEEDGRKIPCNQVTIGELDPDYPLLERALKEINDRNRRGGEGDGTSPNLPSSKKSGKSISTP